MLKFYSKQHLHYVTHQNTRCIEKKIRSFNIKSLNCNLHLSSFFTFINPFAKLRKATISYIMAVRPNEPSPLPLDGFSWNLICEYFLKIFRENSMTRIKNILPEDRHSFSLNSFTMRKVSDNICREQKHTFHVQWLFFSKNRVVY
jgi:hypothetical protein